MASRFVHMVCILFLCIQYWIRGICAETCYEYNYYGSVTRTFYCTGSYECCGTSQNGYCCYSYHYYSHTWNPIGAIIGGVIGGLVLLALLIMCCVCICVKNKGRPGRVVAPTAAVDGASVIMSQSHQQASGYGYQPMPQYPYGTGQTGTSTNPGIASSEQESMVPPPGHVVPPPYPGPSGGAYPAAGGEQTAIPSKPPVAHCTP